ncbi:hypothetical protein CASFOL_015298 [Castilleja foliolosa]|uniref:Uncharacterized protein n=1 Tax=Castilleja foliolosa TaxID=1961234 RepID=A0ABD3DHJ1_9LAMI
MYLCDKPIVFVSKKHIKHWYYCGGVNITFPSENEVHETRIEARSVSDRWGKYQYVATELATDMVVSVGDVKFYLHKFPLLSRSSLLQKLVANNTDEPEIDIQDIPGGPAAFEICAKFCYGMVATLNAYNVVPTRCAAEYLEMYEAVDKGNLVYKIDVFLTSSIFRSWKDSIIALQTTKSFLPLSEELKIVSHCLDSIAGRASTDPSQVDWSYTYDRNKNEINGLRKQLTVPRDWWVEDLCELHIDLYKRVILTIRAKEKMAANIIGESLKAYTMKRVPFFAKKGNDVTKYSYVVETIISLLPTEKNCVSCGFLFKLLQAAIIFECGNTGRAELMRRIAGQLDEASVGDLMIWSSNGDTASVCDVDVVCELVELFVMHEHGAGTGGCDEFDDDIMCKDFNDPDGSKGKVGRLVDGYLAEAARDSTLPLSKFVGLAEMVSGFPRASHDGIYRAVDMYLKEHPSLTKSEKKQICRLMDCKKLSAVACAHAVQNERLPLRVVVQVLFFEQARAAAGSTPDLSGPVKSLLPRGSYGSSATTTTSDEDWDGDRTSGELKGELASLSLGNNKGGVDNADKVTAKKVKKMFSRMWSNKERQVETSESDTSMSTSGEIKDAPVVVRVIGRKTTHQTPPEKLLEAK